MCPKQFPSADECHSLPEDSTRHLSLNGVTVMNDPMYSLKHRVLRDFVDIQRGIAFNILIISNYFCENITCITG